MQADRRGLRVGRFCWIDDTVVTLWINALCAYTDVAAWHEHRGCIMAETTDGGSAPQRPLPGAGVRSLPSRGG